MPEEQSELGKLSDAMAEVRRKQCRIIKIYVEDYDGNSIDSTEIHCQEDKAYLIMFGIKECLDIVLPFWDKIWQTQWSKG